MATKPDFYRSGRNGLSSTGTLQQGGFAKDKLSGMIRYDSARLERPESKFKSPLAHGKSPAQEAGAFALECVASTWMTPLVAARTST